MEELSEGEDFYLEGGLMVFTRSYHLKRGHCCGSGCRHCPYDPRWTKGAVTVAREERLSSTQINQSESIGAER
jgi:hypothetical protein